MKPVSFLCALAIVAVCTRGKLTNNAILIGDDTPIQIVDEKFLSIAIACGLIARHWKHFNTTDPRVLTLARGLQPAVLRIGGSSCDNMLFSDEFQKEPIRKGRISHFLHISDWQKLVTLATQTNLQLLFDVDLILSRPDGLWNSSNFIKFLDYNTRIGYNAIWFELGNEPNNFPNKYNKTINGSELARDFKIMKDIIQKRPFFRKSKIVGADIGQPNVKPGLGLDPGPLMYAFFKAGHQYIDAFTWHQYYMKMKGSVATTVAAFIDPLMMDVFAEQVSEINEVRRSVLGSNSVFPLWMGETSSAESGGAPNISNTYVAGFLWLDKLGVCAVNGYEIVIRQTFYDGWYSLISSSLQPLPDYYLSLLYKQLVGTRVLKLSKLNFDTNLRLYAHCARNLSGDGDIILYGMNLDPNSPAQIKIQYQGVRILEYILSPQYGDLQSQTVFLNDQQLIFENHKLPELRGRVVDDVILPPLRFGFFQLVGAKAEACK